VWPDVALDRGSDTVNGFFFFFGSSGLSTGSNVSADGALRAATLDRQRTSLVVARERRLQDLFGGSGDGFVGATDLL
jgi:hypothetical protein